MLVFFALVLLLALSLFKYFPPSPVSEKASLDKFSSERAMKHLRFIARKPRPSGSAYHLEVKKYLINYLNDLGLEIQIQTFPYARGKKDLWLSNVIARIPGRNSNYALLFVAHYDSVEDGPGANDDGAAVAALLEMARWLKATPQLKNDIILLFSDGEEIGSLGVRAFLSEYSWCQKVALVFNFEARGSRGPVFMFETNEENGWIIKELAKAAPWVISNSLIYEVYKRLPLSGDFSVFKEAGFVGLNFAYIDGSHVFHQYLDDISSVSQRSLQNQGKIMVTLAKYFGEQESAPLLAKDVFYFNFSPFLIIYYTKTLFSLLNAVAVSLFLILLASGFVKKIITLKEILLNLLFFFLQLLFLIILIFLAWMIIRISFPTKEWVIKYNDRTFFWSLIFLSLAVHNLTQGFFRKEKQYFSFELAWLFPWLCLLIISFNVLPSANFIFLWPMLPYSFWLLLNLILKVKNETMSFSISLLISAAFAWPILSILGPCIYLIFSGLTLNFLTSLLIIFILSYLYFLINPIFNLMDQRFRLFFTFCCFLVAFILFIIGVHSSQAYLSYPRPSDFTPQWF